MQQNILTFREWNQNHVKVVFTLDGFVIVYSFEKEIFISGNKETIRKFKDFQGNQLLNLYKRNFEEIQKNYTKLLENIDIIS